MAKLLIHCAVHKDVFDIIPGETTKYNWDIFREMYEEKKIETPQKLKSLRKR